MVFFDTDFKSHLCWQGIKIIIIFFTLNGNIFLQDHLIWLLIWSLSINVMIKLSCAVCTIHYPLGKAENYCSVLHLPHKLIWQLSTFSAVFNSKHSLISEIWPQPINCDLILSCFQAKSQPYQKYDHKQLTAGNMQPVWCLMLFESMKYDFAVRYVIILSFRILVWKIWYLSFKLYNIHR